MPASTNKRVFYAAKQLALRPDATAGGTATVVHGVQSGSIQTNFNLSQVFEWGQISIFENIEDIPDVQISLTKVLDGYPLLYVLSTRNATSPSLAGRGNDKVIATISYYSDTANSAAGNALSAVECSGMFISTIAYNFPLDDNFTEDVTLVGNDKVWKNDAKILNATDAARSAAIVATGGFPSNADAPIGQGGVNRRQDMQFAIQVTGAQNSGDLNGYLADADCTILPYQVFGISSSGVNNRSDGQSFDAHVQSISVSTDLGREAINELGRKSPYHRFATFPVEVTCDVEVISTSGDMVSATENGILTTSSAACQDGGNLSNATIRIATCEGTRLYLGLKNKLQSIQVGGGDSGGGNETITYSFSNFNDLTVMHSGDPNASGATWWANRRNYLIN